jgi:hypothetical protein
MTDLLGAGERLVRYINTAVPQILAGRLRALAASPA